MLRQCVRATTATDTQPSPEPHVRGLRWWQTARPVRLKGNVTVRRTPIGGMRGRTAALIALFTTFLLVLAGCGGSQEDVVVTVTSTAAPAVTVSGLDASAAPESTSEALNSKVRVSSKPKFGSVDIPPNDPVTVTVFSAKIKSLTVTGDISEDQATWSLNQRLLYNTTYTFDGIAVDADGVESPFTGTLATIKPDKTIRAYYQIPTGATVGVAAPIRITFDEPVEDKAASLVTFTATTDKGEITGSWGWLQDEDTQGTGGKQSIVHFRPEAFWPAYTNVHVEAKLSGVNLGSGWGQEDLYTDFTVGREQIVQADVNTFRMVVFVDGKVTKNYPVSYGKESVPGRATVSGIHVVTERYPEFELCNPEFDYCNLTEKWAVR